MVINFLDLQGAYDFIIGSFYMREGREVCVLILRAKVNNELKSSIPMISQINNHFCIVLYVHYD